MSLLLSIFDQDRLAKHIAARRGENKAGQVLRLLPSTEPERFARSLKDLRKGGVRYAILLIPEDIGPRANLGRGGAAGAPDAFLGFFLNVQANRFFDYGKLCLIGNVALDDLVEKANSLDASDIDGLRALCARVDERVAPIVYEIARADLEPIIIGGGNNNSLPIIKGTVQSLKESQTARSIAVVNCDPHADFRLLEGRHSGNPFSYAHDQGLLERYCVLAMHENYNSEDMLTRLKEAGFSYFLYEDFAVRRETSFEAMVAAALAYVCKDGLPLGLELDMDAIAGMPASAMTPFGISPEQAAYYVHMTAASTDTRYFHLSEAAPKCSVDDGNRQVGKILTLLAVTYLKAREKFFASNASALGTDVHNAL